MFKELFKKLFGKKDPSLVSPPFTPPNAPNWAVVSDVVCFAGIWYQLTETGWYPMTGSLQSEPEQRFTGGYKIIGNLLYAHNGVSWVSVSGAPDQSTIHVESDLPALSENGHKYKLDDGSTWIYNGTRWLELTQSPSKRPQPIEPAPVRQVTQPPKSNITNRHDDSNRHNTNPDFLTTYVVMDAIDDYRPNHCDTPSHSDRGYDSGGSSDGGGSCD